MKKLILLLACAMMIPTMMEAKKPKTGLKFYKDSYIYGQSGRNSEKKGSALALTTGTTYSLQNANDQTKPDDIDVMLYFGKVKGDKKKTFHLFAPNNPNVNIDWEKDGGTAPFNKYEGKSDDRDSYYALKNWKVRNATKLQKVSNVDFENATSESIAAISVSDSYIASDINIGDVIAFELAETSMKPGKKGLIKITSIVDDESKPDQAGNGQYQRMFMDIKIQK